MANNSYPVLLTTAVVDGPTLTAAAAATCIPAANKLTLPNGYFTIGKKIRVKASGRISCAVTTPGTVRFDVRVGSVVAFDSNAIALDTVAVANMPWRLEIDLVCRSVGASTSGTLFGSGIWTGPNVAGQIATPPKGYLPAVLPWNAAPAVGTGFDSTASNTFDLFFTQTVGSGSLTVHTYDVEEWN